LGEGASKGLGDLDAGENPAPSGMRQRKAQSALK
jgi:hypothetical protein